VKNIIITFVFKKTYYDPDVEQVISDLLPLDELIIDYDAESLDRAHRITQKLYLTGRQILDRSNSGWYGDVEIGEPSNRKEQNVRVEVFKQHPTVTDDATPYEILEQHTYADLDDDGYEEPVIITLLSDSGTVLRIAPRFEEEGIRADEQGNLIKIEPTQYFTLYGFIPNPVSRIYYLGFNSLCGPLVDTLNTLINQLVDSGTLNTMQGGFLSKNSLTRTMSTGVHSNRRKFPAMTSRVGVIPASRNRRRREGTVIPTTKASS